MNKIYTAYTEKDFSEDCFLLFYMQLVDYEIVSQLALVEEEDRSELNIGDIVEFEGQYYKITKTL